MPEESLPGLHPPFAMTGTRFRERTTSGTASRRNCRGGSRSSQGRLDDLEAVPSSTGPNLIEEGAFGLSSKTLKEQPQWLG